MRKKFLTYILGFVASNIFATSWDQLILSHNELLGDRSIVSKQYHAYVAHQSPTIADPQIKAIPIVENEEDLIDLKEIGTTRLQMMPAPQVPFEQPFFNSGLPSNSKMRVGLYLKLEEMIGSLDLLSTTFGYEPGQICILVFDALRDLNTQSMLFQKKFEEISTLNPHFTEKEAELETAKWVSPVKNNVPVHSTGAAVDLRLWDSYQGEFLDMGPFGVIWGANDTAPTFSENISDAQKKNRLYCLIAAEQAGLVNYGYEFWHFSSKDRVAIYWTGESLSSPYGSIR